jgi:DNA-binding MarR family transcriptional regulator
MRLELDPSRALNLWRSVTVTTVQADEPDLTARQLAVLMTVYLSPAPHTVRGLAATLNLAKPAVTRALDALARLDLIARAPDDRDGRSIIIERTVRGRAYLGALGELISGRAAELAL